MSIYTLAPLAGPAFGPLAGGFIAENTSWRWVGTTYTFNLNLGDSERPVTGLLLHEHR